MYAQIFSDTSASKLISLLTGEELTNEQVLTHGNIYSNVSQNQ
jgi:hypothetical protein